MSRPLSPADPRVAACAPALRAGLQALGENAEALSGPLLAYLDELLRWNAAYNLTAVREPAQMVTRHLLDSLAVRPLIHGPLLDVGAGAGLPGLVLALADPALQVSVLDSNGKKVRFMRHAVRALGLSNVEVIEGRVEQLAPTRLYACIVSRAFASLADFFTLSRHLLAPAGVWVAMKGKLDGNETSAIPAEVTIREIRRLHVPGLAEARHAVIAVQKT